MLKPKSVELEIRTIVRTGSAQIGAKKDVDGKVPKWVLWRRPT
jgi:hypothetical protein